MTVRRAFTIVLAALAAVSLPAAVVASEKAEPKYLKPNAAEFALNGAWQGAKKITGVPQTGVSGVQVAADPAETVWAVSCGPAQQEAVFRRAVELLGPPQGAEVTWSIASEGVTPSSFELKSLSLSVNGKRVFSRSKPYGGFSFRIPSSLLKSFKVGPNTFEVRATRAALPAGKKQCNVHGQKPYVVLAAKFHLDFATDLRVGIPAEKYAVRKSTSVLISQFVKNEGPDAVLGGEMLVDYGGQGTWTVLAGVSAGDLAKGKTGASCEKQGNTIQHCRFGRLAPGQSFPVIVKVDWTPTVGPANWDHNTGAVSFIVLSETPDLNSGNDRVNNNFIMCQEGSTLPECKNAS